MHLLKKKMKGKRGAMVKKLDIKKAYEKLEWSFSRKVIHFFDIMDRWIKLIMSYVSTTATTVLLNESKMQSFFLS